MLASPKLAFVDAHHHLWDLENHHYWWLQGEPSQAHLTTLGDYSAIRKTYLVDDLIRNAAGVGLAKSVHVQADWSDPDPVGETRWLQGLAERYGFPHAIVAFADLMADSAEADLERHCESPNMRGVRVLDPGSRLSEPRFRSGLMGLQRLHLSYELNVTWERMAQALDLAAAFPDLQFILSHTGMPMERTAAYFQEWQKGIRTLAQAPNVAVKISGLGMIDHHWTVASIRPWVLATVEVFGVDRCMFGTNWPVCGLYSSYGRLVAAYRQIIEGFSRHERELILAKNAERIYRI